MNPMLTATMALLLLVNPSYGSLKRLTDALSKMGNNKSQRRSLIEALPTDIPFSGELHVDFGGPDSWVTPYDGDYTFIEIQNGKPAYKMTTCRHPEDPSKCLLGQILNAAPVSGKYQFGECPSSGSPEFDPWCKHPTCYQATDTAQECTHWTVGDEYPERHPIITGFGEDIKDIPICGEVTGNTLKDKLLDTFNCYRSQIALGNVKSNCFRNDCENGQSLPKAAKMSPLVWNDDLALAAQECANLQHDTNICRVNHCSSDLNPFNGNQGVGGWSGYDQYEETYGVIIWFDEKRNYFWGDGQGQSGHFWGVVKENHVEVGCGYAFCPDNDSNYDAQKLIVCNYKSNGDAEWENEGKTYPYKPTEGVAGSECIHSANPSTGLCNL